MMLRLMLAVLVVMLLLALLGKWRRPRVPRNPRGAKIEVARKCPDCGAYVLAGEPCPCTHR